MNRVSSGLVCGVLRALGALPRRLRSMQPGPDNAGSDSYLHLIRTQVASVSRRYDLYYHLPRSLCPIR